MITAIPVNDDRVANHFTKASHLVLVDERGVGSAGRKSRAGRRLFR
jgi:predicted Fe-Mo cluster-binding NifX family protein